MPVEVTRARKHAHKARGLFCEQNRSGTIVVLLLASLLVLPLVLLLDGFRPEDGTARFGRMHVQPHERRHWPVPRRRERTLDGQLHEAGPAQHHVPAHLSV